MADKKTKMLWAMLLDGEPEHDESVEITSAMINEQTRRQMAGEDDE